MLLSTHPAVLKQMVGKKCEIVSVAELYDGTKKRVGVRILGTNVVDALPVEVLLPCVTSPKIITPTQPPPAAVATTAAAAAVGSLMAIPTVDHTITRGGGKSNKKDGVKKGMSSSTGGTKLREKYTKHKQDKKHGATIGTAMTHGDNNNGGIKSSASIPFAPVESGSMGHQGKLYVYDMPPPRTQTSPLQSHDGFDGDGVGQGL